MSHRIRRIVFACVTALVGAGLVACGGDDSDVLIIDPSVTSDNPVTMQWDGMTGEFFYYTADAFELVGNELKDSGQRPVGYWRLTVPEGESPKNLRAKVELLRDGEPVDAYYLLPGFEGSAVKNELVLNNIEQTNSSGLAPREAGPHGDGHGQELASATGKDFSFRLSEISVSDEPFTPSERVEKVELTPNEKFLAAIRRSGISETPDSVVLELAEATCTAAGLVDKHKSEAFTVELLEMSPKYLDRGTEDTFVELTLARFCATSTASTSQATAAPAGASTTATGDDATYLRLLRSQNLGYLEDDEAISIGKLVCEGLDAGRRFTEIGSQIARDSDGLFTLREGATFVGAAISAYCPVYQDLLDN